MLSPHLYITCWFTYLIATIKIFLIKSIVTFDLKHNQIKTKLLSLLKKSTSEFRSGFHLNVTIDSYLEYVLPQYHHHKSIL